MSEPFSQPTLDFGEASSLLGPLYKSPKERKVFLTEYLISEAAAETRLRARLAAMGFLEPDIGEGEFVTFSHFQLPISPGPRARLVDVRENGETIVMAKPYLGWDFDYALIE